MFQWRASIYLIVLILFLVLEHIIPFRKALEHKRERWIANFALTFANAILLTLLPLTAVQFSGLASFGFFHHVAWPAFLEVFLGVLCFDLLIYWQHRLFHRVPFFWRFHRMHHTDIALDVSSAARFHPLEILFSLAIKLLAIAVLGPSATAVFLFEVLLSSSSIFNHANISIPQPLEKILRSIFVTPEMHRIHHSQLQAETDSNFGFNLSIWDRIFHSYTHRHKYGEAKLKIGLEQWQGAQDTYLFTGLLTQPFRQEPKKIT